MGESNDVVSHICQFVDTRQMVRVPAVGRLQEAICGAPAYRGLVFNDFDPIWVCDEHYDALIAQGWRDA